MNVDDLTKPDPQCIHFTDAAPGAETIKGAGAQAAEIDASGIGSKEALLDAVASALDFPDYFGSNWDALDECLRDLSWLPGNHHVLVVRGARQLWSTSPEPAGALVEAWLGAAGRWAEQNVGFHLVFEL